MKLLIDIIDPPQRTVHALWGAEYWTMSQFFSTWSTLMQQPVAPSSLEPEHVGAPHQITVTNPAREITCPQPTLSRGFYYDDTVSVFDYTV